jgi:hypothetical protein
MDEDSSQRLAILPWRKRAVWQQWPALQLCGVLRGGVALPSMYERQVLDRSIGPLKGSNGGDDRRVVARWRSGNRNIDEVLLEAVAARHERHSNHHELDHWSTDPKDDLWTDAKAMGLVQPYDRRTCHSRSGQRW